MSETTMYCNIWLPILPVGRIRTVLRLVRLPERITSRFRDQPPEYK